MLRAIERYGVANVPLPEGPPFFPFSTEDECRQLLASFENVAVRQLPLVWRFASPDLVLNAFLRGSVRTGALLRAQTSEDLDAIQAAVRQEVVAVGQTAHGIELPMPALLVSARKPA